MVMYSAEVEGKDIIYFTIRKTFMYLEDSSITLWPIDMTNQKYVIYSGNMSQMSDNTFVVFYLIKLDICDASHAEKPH